MQNLSIHSISKIGRKPVKKIPAYNHLLIEDKIAHVVREIFDLALAGNRISKIRKHINKQHILRPAAYAAEQGATGYERYFEGNKENRYIWNENSVRGISRSPIYAGNLAGYKRIAANMKSRKRPSKLPEEWKVNEYNNKNKMLAKKFIFNIVIMFPLIQISYKLLNPTDFLWCDIFISQKGSNKMICRSIIHFIDKFFGFKFSYLILCDKRTTDKIWLFSLNNT